MKIKKSFRIDEDFSEQINTLAKSQGITFSQFVELACYAMADEQPKPIKQEESKGKKVEKILLDFWVDQPTFKDLAKIAQSKNSTLSQEVYYRVSASLTAPIFDTIEFAKLEELHFDLNRLGNLMKLAINNKMPVDLAVLESIRNDIQQVNKKIDEAIEHSHKRML